MYLKPRPIDFGIDYDKLAHITENYVSSDIKDSIIDEASRQALKAKSRITMKILEDVIKMLKNASPSPITCIGCLENQPNQLAHMDYGGCLYDCEDVV
jgi:Ni,Fe-hydrogenase III component G